MPPLLGGCEPFSAGSFGIDQDPATSAVSCSLHHQAERWRGNRLADWCVVALLPRSLVEFALAAELQQGFCSLDSRLGISADLTTDDLIGYFAFAKLAAMRRLSCDDWVLSRNGDRLAGERKGNLTLI